MPLLIRNPQMQTLERAHLARKAKELLLEHIPEQHAALPAAVLHRRAEQIARRAIECGVGTKTSFPFFVMLAWHWGAELDENGADPALRYVLNDCWLDGDAKVACWQTRQGSSPGFAWC